MMPANYLSLVVLLVAVVGLACGRSSHSGGWESGENNNMKVESSFKLSMPLFMRNAIDVITSAMPSYPTTTTQRPCGVLACQNGGSLRPRTNGSCPTCECLAGYHGSQCESYSGSTTPFPNSTSIISSTSTTPLRSYNCSTLSCHSGGTVTSVNGSSDSCRCSCYEWSDGEFCEYQRSCFACQNGGKLVINPDGDWCSCSCSPCYYGRTCESFDPSCNPSAFPTTAPSVSNCTGLVCMSGGHVILNDNSCHCACLAGYFGDNCEILNTCIYENPCGNVGTPFYEPISRSCQCVCPPGFSSSSNCTAFSNQ